MKEFMINNKKKLILWSSISVAAVLLCAFAIWALFIPYMYVSLDVNPSIEYSVNHANRVLSAKAVNDDGSDILSGLNLKNKTINDAVKETVQEISDKGYFDGSDPGAVEITTSEASGGSTEESDALAQDLQNDAQTVTTDEGKTVDVEAESIGLDRVKEAKELGISPGKLNLIQKLQASSDNPDSITVDDWKNKPVKDIMKAIKENRKADQTKKGQTDDGSATTTETTIGSSGNTDSTDGIMSDSTVGSTENRGQQAQATNPAAEHRNSNATKHYNYTKAPDNDDAENENDNDNEEQSSEYTEPADSTSVVAEETEEQTTHTTTAKTNAAGSKTTHTNHGKK